MQWDNTVLSIIFHTMKGNNKSLVRRKCVAWKDEPESVKPVAPVLSGVFDNHFEMQGMLF